METSLLHTPEGVRDIYGGELAAKTAVSARIHEVFDRYGYAPVQTPTFEFFDIFSREKGSVASREMYKFFDRNGETLVLRPDITPSIARCVAKYYMFEDMPIRLCYEGNAFINHESLRGSLREMTVIGAELFNDTTTDADAEMVAMLVEALKNAGLSEFQVEIGLGDYIRGLMDDAGLAAEDQEELIRLIEQKNYFGVEKFLGHTKTEDSVREALILLPRLYGGIEQILKARELTKNPRALQALDHLEKLYHLLQVYGLERYITFDLGMLGKFKYYTGIIFQAYTYGSGVPVAAGGRYDGLVSQYGKDAPATGVSIYLDELLTALSRQNLLKQPDCPRAILLYEKKDKDEAVELAGHLRGKGMNVALIRRFAEKTLADYEAYGKRNGFTELWTLTDKKGFPKSVDLVTGVKYSHDIEGHMTVWED